MRLSKRQGDQVRAQFMYLDECGAIMRIKDDATSSEHWTELIRQQVELLVSFNVGYGVIKHLRSEFQLKWSPSKLEQDFISDDESMADMFPVKESAMDGTVTEDRVLALIHTEIDRFKRQLASVMEA